MAKPSVFVLGAQKCGTTTVSELLAEQREIFVPSVKETYFFCDEQQFVKGSDWYEREYYSAASAQGKLLLCDATPFYLCSTSALQRLSLYCGEEARFIVTLRDPVHRAYSAFWHQKRLGNEPMNFEEALEAESLRIDEAVRMQGRWWRHAYTEVGFFAKQLENAFSLLGRERFLVLSGPDLQNLALLQARLREFLRLPPSSALPQTHKANPSTMPRFRSVQHLITKGGFAKSLLKKIIPREMRSAFGRKILSANSVSFDYPAMRPDTKEHLVKLFREDQKKLRDMYVLQ